MRYFLMVLGVGTAAAAGKIVLKTAKSTTKAPFAVKSTAENQWKLGGGKFDLGGEYDWDEQRFAPAAVSLGYRDSLNIKDKAVLPFAAMLSLRQPFTKTLQPTGSLAMGSDRSLRVELDTKALLPKRIAARRSIKGLTLNPSWAPRNFDKKSRGLELKSKLELNGKRAIVSGAVAPFTRPKCKFEFEVDADGSTRVRFEPLLGPDAKLTRYELEHALPSRSAVDTVTASLYDDLLELKARIPLSLAELKLPFIKGAVFPTLSAPVSDFTNLKFSVSSQFDL